LKVSLYIAKRYLFAKKKHHVINLISWISVCSVAVVSFALITVLSAFNGLEKLVEQLYESFDPDVRISAKTGKVFDMDAFPAGELEAIPGVAHYAEVIEELALINYNQKQAPATIKGVTANYQEMNGIDSMMIDGEFMLTEGDVNYAVLGYKIASNLSVNLADLLEVLKVYAPKRTGTATLNPERAFRTRPIAPSGIFLISPDFDAKYVLVPLRFAQEIFDYDTERSSIEIALAPGANEKEVIRQIKALLGNDYDVRTREQLNEIVYKTNKTEKWVTFLILTFILLVAAFNIIGSLTMLILDKKKDISILKSMGASNQLIRSIFLMEGMLINGFGAFIGLALGIVLCLVQQHVGLLRLEGGIVEFYPVVLEGLDITLILVAVFFIGWLASYFPVRVFTRYYF
jgi:lipoprotein-releasing system permease protein